MIARPQDIPAAFASAFNAGDIDALLALYTEDAVLVADGVAEVKGPAIREALKGFLGLKGPMTMTLKRAVEGAGTAVVVAEWSLTSPDGQQLSGKTSDVLEQSADGGWRYKIDAPFGVKA